MPVGSLDLAYMHEQGCKCSRCTVARNYARLRATVTDGPEADAAQPVTTESGIWLPDSVRGHLDVVSHGDSLTP